MRKKKWRLVISCLTFQQCIHSQKISEIGNNIYFQCRVAESKYNAYYEKIFLNQNSPLIFVSKISFSNKQYIQIKMCFFLPCLARTQKSSTQTMLLPQEDKRDKKKLYIYFVKMFYTDDDDEVRWSVYPLLLNNVLLVRTNDHRNTRCATPAVICLK